MLTLRCTVQLLKRLGPPADDVTPISTLGDWCAKLLTTHPRYVVLCTNERTLLSVVVPLAPATKLLERFVAAARTRIDQVQAPAEARAREIALLADVRVGRTRNRSVVGSMNDFGYAAEYWLAERPTGDLEALGQYLCDTPCQRLSTKWPWREAELRLNA